MNKIFDEIKDTNCIYYEEQIYGMRSGKTLLSKYLNELLVALGDKQ